MLSLKQLNKIDKVTTYAAYGWIRENESKLKLKPIPAMISAICLCYFREDEIFDIINEKDTTLSSARKVIKCIKKRTDYDSHNNNFGAIQVSSMNDLIYEWKLKIVNTNWDSISVGIASKIVTDKRLEYIDDIYYYLFCCDYPGHGFKTCHLNDRYLKYGEESGRGDIVIIHLDLKRAEIRLNINDKVQEVAFENVKKAEDIKYRLVVGMSNYGDCIQIVDFRKCFSAR